MPVKVSGPRVVLFGAFGMLRRLCVIVLLGVIVAGALTAWHAVRSERTTHSRNPPAAGAAHDLAAARPRTIIFILVDTLRADRLGAYGHARGLSPTLDALAADGIVFDRAIAPAPWTQPSIASLFCSYYPSVHKVLKYGKESTPNKEEVHYVSILADTFRTLAECLRDAGYVTAGFVANPFLLREYGFAQGFDHYDTSFAKNTAPGSVVNDAVVEWLERDTERREPVFLYLHYMDVHGPYNARPELLDNLLDGVERNAARRRLSPRQMATMDKYLRKLPKDCPDPERHERLWNYLEYWEARYEAGIREFDVYLGDLQSRLSAMGLWDEAYVIITADHGEELCEHGLWGHGWSTFHAELHVPLILRWPGRLTPGRRVGGNVRLIDIMPTLLEQLGLAPAEGSQGASLVPLIAGRPRDVPLPAFAEGVKARPHQRAVYLDQWKLIADIRTGAARFFDVAIDPLETKDLSTQRPQQRARLVRVLREQVQLNEQQARDVDAGQAPLSAEQIERLKSLGYVGD